MKHRLTYAARTANLGLPGGDAKAVMDFPLYPVHRFAHLVASFAAAFQLPGDRLRRDRGFKASHLSPRSGFNFYRISTLKSWRPPPILSCRKTGSGYRKQPGGITGGRLIKGLPRGRDVAQ